MKARSGTVLLLLILGLGLFPSMPIFAQEEEDRSISIFEKALRNALIEVCYGTRVMVDLNDPETTEVSLDEAGLSPEVAAALVADAAQTDGSYEALSDLLIAYCLGPDVVTNIWAAGGDTETIQVILIDAGVIEIDLFSSWSIST